MNGQLVDPFVRAAVDVLGMETRGPVTPGAPESHCDPHTTDEITAVVGMSGDVRGSMFLSMSTATALATVSAMLGQPMVTFDPLVQSGIAELANVIAGHAASALARAGMPADLTPPLMVLGAGARIQGLDAQRVAITIDTDCGLVHIHVALAGG
jgi:chemotaxis protein CheX